MLCVHVIQEWCAVCLAFFQPLTADNDYLFTRKTHPHKKVIVSQCLGQAVLIVYVADLLMYILY